MLIISINLQAGISYNDYYFILYQIFRKLYKMKGKNI